MENVQPCDGCGSSDASSNYFLHDANAGKWTHIAISFDGCTVTFYINGALDSTKTLQPCGINTFTPPLEIGSVEGISQARAKIGAFRISNGVKSSFPYGAFALVNPEPTTSFSFALFLPLIRR